MTGFEFFKNKKTQLAVVFVLVAGVGFGIFIAPRIFPTTTENQIFSPEVGLANVSGPVEQKIEPKKILHLPTPKQVKAIYMTSWVAGTPSFRSRLIELIEQTELNSVVIDIKDYTGKIAFLTDDPRVTKYGAPEKRIFDIVDFLEDLHLRGIYVIGRISVFQDVHLADLKSEWAVKKDSNRNTLWRDHKELPWIDAGARDAWRYFADIGHVAYELGFDELNFDYIRFPSDGNMKDIFYPWSEGKEKREVIREFFEFLANDFQGTGAVLSADLFGMTTISVDDLNIGQYLEYALPYFDFIAPMVYPSHYPPNWNGHKNPAEHPYEVVKYSMEKAVERASTTPLKFRPWLQDFNLGAIYDAEKVRAQIQATYDSGLDSFMLWSPSNKYTREALLPAGH